MTSRRPNLLVLTSTFPRWPDDTRPPFVFELSQRLVGSFEVTVLTPRAPGSRRLEVINGVRVIRYPYFVPAWESLVAYEGGIMGRLKSSRLAYLLVPFLLAGQLYATFRLLRRERVDVVHAHWLIPQGLIAVIARKLAYRHVPLVCTAHGSDVYSLRVWPFDQLRQWIVAQSQALTVVSSPMATVLTRTGAQAEKIRVLPMGVSVREVFTPDHGILRSACELLFVGRLVDGKGIDILLEAMPRVLERVPDLRLTIVGGGPAELSLGTLSERLGIASRVDFMGVLPNKALPALYRRASIFVAPFITTVEGEQEGLGLVIIEAMACECPVVASRFPAVFDMIDHGVSGLLVEPGEPAPLAETLIDLLEKPEWREELGRTGRESIVDRFDWESIGQRYSALLDEAADHADRR